MELKGVDVAVKTFHATAFDSFHLKLLKKEITTMRSIQSEYNCVILFSRICANAW